ncbi:hypothetical protein E4T56_gene11392, partial [Termitomyces sp. T112]
MFLTPYPSLPDPSQSITMSSEGPTPPTDPIRIPPQPALGLYPTPVDSAQLRRLPLPYPPPSGVPSIPLAPYISTNSVHAPRPKHSYDNSDPHSPLGPRTHQAQVTPYPTPALPPSLEKPRSPHNLFARSQTSPNTRPGSTTNTFSLRLLQAIQDLLGLFSLEPPRKPSHLRSNSRHLVISAGHHVHLVRTCQCTEPPSSAEPDIISRLPLTPFSMSAFNPAYNPVSYPTDAYGRSLLENPYAPFYPGPFADQYVPCHWTPDPNQAFYAPSISQGIPLGWRRPPAFHANGNNPCINPGGYSAAPPNPAYLPPTHYYAYPIPAAAPVPPEPM